MYTILLVANHRVLGMGIIKQLLRASTTMVAIQLWMK